VTEQAHLPSQCFPERLNAFMQPLSLDQASFGSCLDGTADEIVTRDQKLARSLGVSGTPTFFVGAVQADRHLKIRTRLAGAQTIEGFSAVLDPLLSEASSPGR
jgi:protein-disulfide isomerase